MKPGCYSTTKGRNLVYCDKCTVLGKPLRNQHDFCKTNTLSFMKKHLRRLFYTSRVSDLHASPATRKATHTLYPYRFSHGDTSLFSRRFKSSLFIPPIRHSVLGRTYGTYLHYERSYAINVFFIRSFGEQRLRFDLPAKLSVFSPQSP